MSQRYANLIGGRWSAPETGDYAPNINPADRYEVIGEFPLSGETDAVRAVEAAASAQPSWAALSAHARGEYLRRAADILESRAGDVARDLMREEGKTLAEARGETLRGVTILRYFAGQTLLPDGEVIPSANARTMLYTRRVPVGVCTLITPWNFPIAIPLWKAAPALAFGNTVVLKPAGLAPMTAWHIAQCFVEAELPAGVFNVVYGEGSQVGKPLTTHRAVNAISFTGSVKTGKIIASQATEHGKKYQLEMGGKNAVIVMPDADLEQAVNLTIQGAFRSAGEKCTATARAIVHRDIYDTFAERLVEKTRTLKVGPGDDPDAYFGPVISETAQKDILRYIEIACGEGARLLCGGGVPVDERLAKGFYVMPTVFGEVKSQMRIAQEEVFGPVLCLMRAEDLDHAITILNDVEFGLSASIFTRDLNTAMTFVERAQAGMLRVNGETAGVEPQAPFGGMKASSSYSREQGLAARDFFTQIKTISIDRAG